MINVFDNIFNNPAVEAFTISQFVLCVLCGLLVGALIGAFYASRNEHTESFITTIVLIPAIVAIIIVGVNGNIGTGIAVAGAFALVRFRSAPGKAKEIGAIFMAMGSGLLIGVGYLAYAILFTIIVGLFYLIYEKIRISEDGDISMKRTLNVTVPEDLDYCGVLDDILDKYASYHHLRKVKTTNMGSMFRLTYDVTILDERQTKPMIDEIRCRNGNLEVSLSDASTEDSSL